MLKLIKSLVDEGLEICNFYDYDVKLNSVRLHTDSNYLGIYYPETQEITIWEGLSHCLEEVVFHEIAHAVQFQFEPEKRFHGPNWRRIMKEVFELKPRAKIPINFLNFKRKRGLYLYQCKCGLFPTGLAEHKKLQEIQMYCSDCSSVIHFKRFLGNPQKFEHE